MGMQNPNGRGDGVDCNNSLFFFFCLMKTAIFTLSQSNQNFDYVSKFRQLVSCILSSSVLNNLNNVLFPGKLREDCTCLYFP